MLMFAKPQYLIIYISNLINHENNTGILEKCCRKSDNHAAKLSSFQFWICVQSHFNVLFNNQFAIEYYSHVGFSFTHHSVVLMGVIGISNHQPNNCFLNRLFKCRSKKSIKAPLHWHLFGDFTGYLWIPCTNGQ